MVKFITNKKQIQAANTNLEYFINLAKQKVLMDLKQQFIEDHDLVTFNSSSHAYQDLFNEYIKKEFNVGDFIEELKVLLPDSKNTTINSSLSSASLLLDNLFQLIDENPEVKADLLAFNKKHAESLSKKEFDIFYSCILANYVERLGHLKNTRINLAGKELLDLSDNLIEVKKTNQYETYEVLSNEDALHLKSIIGKQHPFYTRLLQQLDVETLLNLYDAPKECKSNKVDFFAALLKKPNLTSIQLHAVYQYAKYIKLADYILAHAYKNLSLKMLNLVVQQADPTKYQYYLKLAIKNNLPNYVISLLQHNPALIKSLPYNPIHFAVDSAAVDVIAALEWFGNCYLNAFDPSFGDTPAHLAIRRGNIAVLVKLKELGAYLDVANEYGETLVHFAVRSGNVAVLVTLAELGADVNRGNRDGETPVHWAVKNANMEMLIKLKELNANLDCKDRNGETPAYWAVGDGNVEILAKLKEFGANLNVPNLNGYTLAHRAALKGQVVALAKLKELGVNLDICSNYGETPAFYAALKGQVVALAKLKELGVNLDICSNYGETPAFYAASEGHFEVIKYLSENNVNLYRGIRCSASSCRGYVHNKIKAIRDRMEEKIQEMEEKIQKDADNQYMVIRPLDIAEVMGHMEIAAYLQEKERLQKLQFIETLPKEKRLAAVTGKNDKGNTLLHLFAKNLEVLSSALNLLPKEDRLAAITKKNVHGDSVIHLVASDPETLKVILYSLSDEDCLKAVKVKNKYGQTSLELAKTLNPEVYAILNALLQKNRWSFFSFLNRKVSNKVVANQQELALNTPLVGTSSPGSILYK